MLHERTVITLLILALGMRPPGTRARMSCMLALRQDRAPRPPCLVSNRDVKWHACRLLSCFCAPARPSLVFRSWVRCVWVWGWGSIARVTRLWLFLFQSLRPLVGLVSWFQRYQIINLSYLGLTVLLKTTCPMGGG